MIDVYDVIAIRYVLNITFDAIQLVLHASVPFAYQNYNNGNGCGIEDE
jgi:hypothetical protein